MTKAKKLPSGKWRVRISTGQKNKNGKYVYKSFTASTKREAEMLGLEYENAKEDVNTGNLTVGRAVETYIANRSDVLSPTTISGYKQSKRLYLCSLDEYLISSLTSEDIQRLVNEISKKQSPKTVRNAYGLLIASLRANGCEKVFTVTLPQKKTITRNIPTKEQVKLLLDNSSGDLRVAILLSSIGTLRRGEICALKYEDIKGNTIHIHSDMILNEDRKWIVKDIPKTTSSDRYVEFPAEVIKEIGTGKGYIMSLNPNALTQQFCKLRNKLDLKCRFHDLRHYAASIMHVIGVPDQYIMQRGGWSSDSILKQVYRNVLEDEAKSFSDKTNAYFRESLL